MDIKKKTVEALSVLLAITISSLQKITRGMDERETSKVYDIFVQNIKETLAVDSSDRGIYDYEYSRTRSPQEIMRASKWKV